MIVIVGDVHEGLSFPYRIDAESGISERAIDIHKNFANAASYAIEQRAKLFIVVGDLFDRTHVAPNFRELVRRDVIEPLASAGIEVWILAGNHDQPHNSSRSTSLEDFRGYPHVAVFRKPSFKSMEIEGRKVDFIILPYMHPEHIAALVREKLKKENIPSEQLFSVGQEMLKGWMKNRAEECKGECKILLGHYYIEGAKLRETYAPEVLPGEFSLRRDAIPDVLDFAVFGHVHLHQNMGRQGSTEVIYTGALERIDWGEREDRKGFVAIDVENKKWQFIELPCREMLKISVVIEPDEEPTQKILDAIGEVKDKLVRLEVKLSEGQRIKVEDHKLEEKLRKAFYYEVRWSERSGEKRGFAEFTLSPFELLRKYVEANYSQHPRREEILRQGEEILKEVLE